MSLNYTDIVTMIMKKADLQTVLNAMAELLQSALVFSTETLKILASSKTIPAPDPYWDQAIEDGRCSPEMLSIIYESPAVKNTPRPTEIVCNPSYSPDQTTLKYYCTMPAKNFNQKVLLHAMPLKGRLEKRQQDLLLSFFCLAANVYFQNDRALAHGYQGHRGILQSLLNPDYEQGSDSAADDSATFDNIQMLVLSPEYQEINDLILYVLVDALSGLLGNDYTTVHNNSVVVMFKAHKMDKTFLEQLQRIAIRSNARAGISWIFSGRDQVRRHYKQAVFCLEMAKKLHIPGRIHTYDNMYIWELVENCRRREHWVNIEHPVLSTLREYDAENSSCLYDTLYTLLKCDMNSSLAAKKLDVHKSTLYHRTEVLKDLVPGLLDKSADWQASVMLAFDLARLKNKQ